MLEDKALWRTCGQAHVLPRESSGEVAAPREGRRTTFYSTALLTILAVLRNMLMIFLGMMTCQKVVELLIMTELLMTRMFGRTRIGSGGREVPYPQAHQRPTQSLRDQL